MAVLSMFKIATVLSGFVVSDEDLLAATLTLEDNNYKGMCAISEVVWNRAEHNPKNIRKVLLKKWQFSCLNNHTVKGESLVKIIRNARSRSNWNIAKGIAKDVLSGKVTDLVGGSTHYHVYKGKSKVFPFWTHTTLGGKNTKCKIVSFIGDHVYLKEVN
jgi:spore germination cell wall hydrolase CwlJ-like protein